MPNIITLPGVRDGADNVFVTQAITSATRIIATGERIYSSLTTVFWGDYNHGSLANSGRIWNIFSGNVSSAIGGYYIDRIENSGLIVSEAPNGNAYAISVGSGGSMVRNSGQVYAVANGNAVAISHWDPYVLVDNTGLVAAYAPAGSAAGVGSAVAVAMYNGGFLRNGVGGSILAEGIYATAVIFSRGHLIDPKVPHIINAGRIEAYATGANIESIAISTGALTVETLRIENSGLIRADIAYLSGSELGYSPPQQPADQIFNLAGGEIYGRIETRLGNDRLVNSGLIHGDVLMGEGADLVDTSAGTLVGVVDMGWGNDLFLGGAGDDVALGGRDADWMEGGAGNDLLLGGLGDDILIGDAGNDGLFGELGDDWIITAGGDVVDAGGGDDIIEIEDLSFRSINGGAGLDRLVLAMSAVSLDLAQVRAAGRLVDIEAIELRGQQRVIIRSGDAFGLSGEDTLRLVTTMSDSVELIGSWNEFRIVVEDGVIYRHFTNGSENLLVAGGGAVVVADAPSAPGRGLDPIASGPTAPLAGSVVGADLSGSTAIFNQRPLHGTEVVQSYEIWRSEDGQPVLSPVVVSVSVINHGVIESFGPGNGGAKAFMIWNMDRIVNHGTIRAAGNGNVSADAVYTLSWGAVTNYGLVEAISESGRATGLTTRGSWYDGLNLVNYGTISATTNGTQPALGAAIGQDEAAFNYGTIVAVGGDGTVAAQIYDQRQFTNNGTIMAGLAAGAVGSATGLFYTASVWGTTVINRGLIRGERAVAGGDGIGSPGNLLFYNFGRLEGTVTLQNGLSKFENWGEVTGDARLGSAINLWHAAGGRQLGTVFGGDGSDMLVGSAAADVLNGENGDDYLRGGGGGDTLTGGAGRDVFVYEATSDSIVSAFDTITDFASGIDRIDLTALGVQNVSLVSGPGYTQLIATTLAGTLWVRVGGTLALSDLILVHTTEIDGSANADMLFATAGGSILRGGMGDDVLIGGAGNDRLEGGAGFDVMWGGAGDDVYVLSDDYDLVWEVTGEGTDRIDMHHGGLLRMPDNVENVTMFNGGYVRGNGLANIILGSAGNDDISGEAGNDWLEGGAGNDRLNGGAGSDVLYGGAGADTFLFWLPTDSESSTGRSDGKKSLPDFIGDFVSGEDRIDLSAIDAIAATSGNDAFTFIGTSAFSMRAGQLRVEMLNGHVVILGDVDGNGLADLQILVNAPAIQLADFIL